jgi:hypothetical protein
MRHGVITVSPGERVSRVMQLMTPRAAKLKSTHLADLPVESFRSGLIRSSMDSVLAHLVMLIFCNTPDESRVRPIVAMLHCY